MARIVLFGATGYTGKLAAQALVNRGEKPVLAARSPGKLDDLAAELGGGLETATADVSRPDTVRALVERGDVLVTTVGPFARWGGPAVEAAIASGAHYVDSTGEPEFVRAVFERYGPGAQAAGCGLVTAMGYDWVPGNLAGALALREAGDRAIRVDLGYFMTGRAGSGDMSGGTRASAAGAVTA
ncbi:MAG TPA: saccharopine dehydrogenase NADP-binding domain-containing protein, partial [Solirubrobacteraceae bacterium]|nr:saccharopine dehydrogenase NADP-binding domain-containing protein [Solirubrobacteraceae bacterium]